MSDLLVVAGEASGDRAGAAVVERLSRLQDVHVFGLGGDALARAGADLLGHLRTFTAMGVGDAAVRSGRVWQAWRAIGRRVRTHAPRAALLVGYTEFNAFLAPRLHARDIRVLWYGAPQVWAWRRGRIDSLRRAIDRLAVILPFEEELWRSQGVDAHYVGHPALETVYLDRHRARATMGMTTLAAGVALLPGSRPHEVRRLLPAMLSGYAIVRSDRASVDARVLVAPSLDAATRSWMEGICRDHGVTTFEVGASDGAGPLLPAFDVALCASGTATLEAALARAVPIVTYRVGPATELAARALLRTPHVALPNVLLGRRAFPELVQRQATGARIGQVLADVLDRRTSLVADCNAVEACLRHANAPSRHVAQMLAPWLTPTRFAA